MFNSNNKKKFDTLPVDWTKHLKDSESIEAFTNRLHGSRDVLEIIDMFITSKMNKVKVFKEEDYKQASWAYEAADRNGYNRALTELLNFITPVTRKGNLTND